MVGPQFNDLHKFFEGQYEELDDMIDAVAERARSLDGWAFGTLAEFSQHARLKEEPGKYPPAREMIAALLADHEVLIRQLRIDLEACAENITTRGPTTF